MTRKKRKRKLRRHRCGGKIDFLRNLAKTMKSNRRRTSMVPGGGPLFQRMFTRLGCDGRPPRFRVEFYPYSSLVLTIRRREEVVYVRFSDLLRRAPLAVWEGAAALLLARVYRRKASGALTGAYREYARSDRTRSRMNQMRSGRVRLAATNPRGGNFERKRSVLRNSNARVASWTGWRAEVRGWGVSGLYYFFSFPTSL